MGHSASRKLLGIEVKLSGKQWHFWRWIILEDKGVSRDGTLLELRNFWNWREAFLKRKWVILRDGILDQG